MIHNSVQIWSTFMIKYDSHFWSLQLWQHLVGILMAASFHLLLSLEFAEPSKEGQRFNRQHYPHLTITSSEFSGSNLMVGIRAAQLGELSTTAGYPWKLSMSAYLQNFATKNAVFTNLRNKNAVFTHFRDKYAVFTHFCVKNLWFHRYVTICLTRASTYTFRSCFVIILSPQVRA